MSASVPTSGPSVEQSSSGARASAHIAAPVHKVFKYVADLAHMVDWWPEHTRYRLVSGDGGAQSRYAWTYKIGPVPLPGETVVLERSPDERFAYVAGPPGGSVTIAYRFSPDGEGTRVDATVTLTGLARAGLVAGRFASEMRRALETLQSLLAPSVRMSTN